MHHLSFGKYEIEVTNENGYTAGSADNNTEYDLVYCHPEDTVYAPSSSYGIKVYEGTLYRTAIVMAVGGATRVYSDSALIDGENFLLTCCNKVFCLRLPDLQLNWVVVADMATCFSIHMYKDSYIIHGEMTITRLDRTGKIIWQVGARDIFVNIGNIGDTFQMHDEYIELMDWDGSRYKLFYDGTIIDDGMAPLLKNE